ncbi:MAG: hypothetical protein ABH868_06520 [bacterium]
MRRIILITFVLSLTLAFLCEADEGWQGESRWRLKIYEVSNGESYGEGGDLFNPMYLYNRTQLKKDDTYKLGIVFRKGRNEPDLSVETLRKYYLLKYYFVMKDVFFDTFVVGNYKLKYGQGLVFYQPFSEIARPVKIKYKGISEDSGTNPNAYFKGIAFDKRFGNIEGAFFYSEKRLDASRNTDGTIKTELESIRDNYGYLDSASAITNNDVLTERLVGARAVYHFSKKSLLGITGYESSFTPGIDPPDSKGEYTFRGNKNAVWGADAETSLGGVDIVAEVARTRDFGGAYIFQPMLDRGDWMFWSALYRYDSDYYNQHSSALTTDNMDEDINEEGFKAGVEYNNRKLEVNVHFDRAYHPYMDDNLNPSHVNVLWFDSNLKLNKDMSVYFRQWSKQYMDKAKNDSGVYEDMDMRWHKTRLQLTVKPSRSWQLKTRADLRRDVVANTGVVETGYLLFEDIKYTASKKLTLEGRLIYFNAPGVYVSAVEPLWKNSYASYFWNSTGTGIRYYIIINVKAGKGSEFWVKYEHTDKCSSDYRSDYAKLQYDVKW